MTEKKLIIAIDGYSSTGKSSISKEIARRLGVIHLDTGALYRGVTYYALQHCQNEGKIDLNKLREDLNNLRLEFKEEAQGLVLYLNGQNIAKDIRTQEVSDQVSLIAKQPEVRDYLLHTQRAIAQEKGAVLDGRDIGTVVFPNADYKFFLTASIEERTKRRFEELKHLGMPTPYEVVKQNLLQRDEIDSTRAVAPLVQAPDAILIDNTKYNQEDTMYLILSYITEYK